MENSSKSVSTAFGYQSASELRDVALAEVLQSYTRYYASGEGNTARAKRLDLRKFLEYLARYRAKRSEAELTVGDWDQSSTQGFVDHLLKVGESPATVARRLATLKHMGRSLAERVAGFVNPARDARAPKLPVLRPKALTRKELDEAIDRAESRIGERPTFIRRRNFMLFQLLIDTGLRAEEARDLRFSQLTPALDWINTVRTKGRRYRNVYLTSVLRPRLESYLMLREKELARFFPRLTTRMNRSLPLFVSTYGANPAVPESFLMGAKSIWRAIRELSTETGLHPHLLRHSFAHELLSASGDIRLVSQALGHSDLRITMRYTERGDLEVAKALEGARKRK